MERIMSDKKEYEAPKIIYEQKIGVTGGGCSLEPGNTTCESQGYVTFVS